MENKFYITTAIDYANGEPHLGHAYEKVLADVIARYRRLMGDDVYFLTGLDEHGQKVEKKANDNKISPIQFCDKVAEKFHSLLKVLDISNSDFIRTTEARHVKTVQGILEKLYADGLIYKAKYEGYYSVKEERFLQLKDQENGEWPKHFGEVKSIEESNYFFRLSKYQDWLIKALENGEFEIVPSFRKKQVLEFLKEPLNDLCISRPKNRLKWGIELPFDDEYVTYVWFDALLNYLSGASFGEEGFEHLWPADLHVIGKDILLPAHSIYWPIMLKALDLPLPKKFLVHGWWLTAGDKLSKSAGNVFDVFECIEKYGSDALRYFMLKEMVTGQDAEFSEEKLGVRYQSELANDWGNLVSRTLNMLSRYSDGVVPEISIVEEEEKTLQNIWADSKEKTFSFLNNFEFSRALDQIFIFIREINRYAEKRSPWKLAKLEDKQNELLATLAVMAEGVRLSATVLLPFLPSSSLNVLNLIGCDSVNEWQQDLLWSNNVLSGKKVAKKAILFPRIN